MKQKCQTCKIYSVTERLSVPFANHSIMFILSLYTSTAEGNSEYVTFPLIGAVEHHTRWSGFSLTLVRRAPRVQLYLHF